MRSCASSVGVLPVQHGLQLRVQLVQAVIRRCPRHAQADGLHQIFAVMFFAWGGLCD